VFTKKLNKKMLRAAFAAALSQKVRDQRFTVVDSMEEIEPKTARMATLVRALSGDERISALVIPAAANTAVFRATRNLPYVKSISPLNLNMQDILSFRRLIIDRAALDAVISRYTSDADEK
jgi:large subunit ribosomal protein L4